MIMSPLIKLKEHTTSIQILLIDAFSTPPLGFPPKVRGRGLGTLVFTKKRSHPFEIASLVMDY